MTTYRALARRAWLVTRSHANPIRRHLAPRIAFALLCTIGAAIPVTFAYTAGQASHAQLALDAYEREAHYRALGLRLLNASTRALSVVLTEDAELHESIRVAIPEWHSMVVIGRAVLEVEP